MVLAMPISDEIGFGPARCSYPALLARPSRRAGGGVIGLCSGWQAWCGPKCYPRLHLAWNHTIEKIRWKRITA